MDIDSQTGLLQQAEFIASPNCDAYPDPDAISLLVIHNISLPPNDFSGDDIILLFTNQLPINKHPFYAGIAEAKVSAHLLIRRDGHLIQFVPFNQRAWHAGESNYEGRRACNDFSIGIELEGADDIDYEDVQYQQLAEVTKVLLKNYANLSAERIVGHSDIAPIRKTDPGVSFSWHRYKQLLD